MESHKKVKKDVPPPVETDSTPDLGWKVPSQTKKVKIAQQGKSDVSANLSAEDREELKVSAYLSSDDAISVLNYIR